MSAAPGHAGVLEIRCRKRLRKVVEAGSTRFERLEDLPVAIRVGTTTRYDVSSVLAVAAGRPCELVVACEYVSESVTKSNGFVSSEFVRVRLYRQTEDRAVCVGRTVPVGDLDGRNRVRLTVIPAGEFRDQERLDSRSSYSIGRPARRKALLSSVCQSLSLHLSVAVHSIACNGLLGREAFQVALEADLLHEKGRHGRSRCGYGVR